MNKEVTKLPKGYWFNSEGEATTHLQLLWNLFNSRFPHFLVRREKVSSDMINTVMNDYKKLTGDSRITFGKIQQQLKPSFDKKVDSEAIVESKYYSKYDRAMVMLRDSNRVK